MDGFDPKQAARNKHRASQQKKRGRGRPRGGGRGGRSQGDRPAKDSDRPSLDQYIHLPVDGDDRTGPSLDRMEQDALPDLSKNWEYLLSMAGSPVQQELKYQEEKIWGQYAEGQGVEGPGLDHLTKCLSALPLSYVLNLNEEDDASLLTMLSSSEPPAPKRSTSNPTTSASTEEILMTNLMRQRAQQAPPAAEKVVEKPQKPHQPEEQPQERSTPAKPKEPTSEDNEDDLLDDLLNQPSGSLPTENTKPVESGNGEGEEEDLEDWLDSVL